MSTVDSISTPALLSLFEDRRSARKLGPGTCPAALVDHLREAAATVPSSYGAQPWRVVILRERNNEFWELACETIIRRLEGDRRERYLTRAEDMRHGGMTLLIFEDLQASMPRNGQSAEAARDHTVQALGMLQLTLWLTITAHRLSTSPQHWQEFLEDIALRFVGLPRDGFRLVAFMPVGEAVEEPEPRPAQQDRVDLEVVDPRQR